MTARTRPPAPVALAVALLALLVIAAVLPQVLGTHDPFVTDAARAFQPPSFGHIFGTDYAGRDIYSRLVYGTQQSLAIGFGATVIGVGAGLVLGLGAALSPRAVDVVLGRLIEVLFVFPTILFALVVITFLGTGVWPLIVAVGVGTIPDSARLIRAQALTVRHGDYVLASHALGRSSGQVLVHTIVPNVIRPIAVIVTLGIGQAILWASGLSFLGLGAQPPSPEWGTMLADGRNYIVVAWWMTFFPGVLITVSALSLTVLGRYLQKRSEGRLQ